MSGNIKCQFKKERDRGVREWWWRKENDFHEPVER